MTDTAPAKEEIKGQEFNLKPTETQLLVITQNNQQAVFAAILSQIAVDRLGYQVTDRTQFKLSPALDKMEIGELPEPPVPTAKADTPATQVDQPPNPPKPPKSGVVAAA
jgi:hypothetical protein